MMNNRLLILSYNEILYILYMLFLEYIANEGKIASNYRICVYGLCLVITLTLLLQV